MFVLGSAHLDLEKQLLITGSGTVALPRKPFLVLCYLIENRHRLILRSELLDQFWEGKQVYDQSLSKAVGSIRKAFGETRDSSIFIETRWGIGYRYVGPFGAPTEAAESEPIVAEMPAAPPVKLEGSFSVSRLSPLLWVGLVGAIAFVLLYPRLRGADVHASVLGPSRGNHTQPVAAPDTTNTEAHSAYLRAEFFASSRTQSSLLKAIDLLHEAILLDPNYARAYAALAGCYQLLGFYHFAPPDQAYPQGKAAALKALSLDNSLAEAHAVLLSIYTDYDWDWSAAEREFKATIAIDPNYAVAYQFYGYALLGMGKGEEGLATMKHAAEIDPVSPSIQTSLGWALYLMRQYDQAALQCHRVLELHPDFVPAHQLLGFVLGQMKLDDKSLAELYTAQKLEPDSSITPALIAYELARTGKKAEAVSHLNTIFENAQGGSLPDYYLAAAWVAVGDKQQAQMFLNRAYKARSNWIIYLQYDPRFDDLRTDARFQSLVYRVTQSHPGVG